MHADRTRNTPHVRGCLLRTPLTPLPYHTSQVSFAVWTGRLEYLAKRIVQLRPDPLSEAQLVEMMRERLKPVASDGMGSKQRVRRLALVEARVEVGAVVARLGSAQRGRRRTLHPPVCTRKPKRGFRRRCL